MSAVVLYRYGVLVNIPQPARYAIHKLIVATRRNRASVDKATKDVRQAAELIQSLAEIRPDELEAAWLEARERGAKWRKSMDAGVRRLPRQAKDALNESLAA